MTAYRRKEQIGDCTLYLGDCLDILPTLEGVDAVVTDPPYGINWDPDCSRFTGGQSRRSRVTRWSERVTGDDVEFNANHLLQFKQVIVWGAHAFVTPGGSMLVWVKRNDAAFGSFLSDAEVAYMKGGHGVYCYRDVSRNGAGRNFEAFHPNEKPVGLMGWCVAKTTGVVADFYMGSGTTGVACVHLGRKFIGIEIEETYFDIACERIAAAERQPDMFVQKPEQESFL